MIEQAGSRTAWVELQPLTGRTHQLRVHMAAIGHPIVGDGKYGLQDAFLTGGISRKMHLHARRIRMGHPDGGKLDVTAELPRHFAESMALLGFDLSLGEQLPMDERAPPTKTEQKAMAKAHAKTVRKERRGERRGRGETGKSAPARKPPSKNTAPKKAPAKGGGAKAGPGKPSAARRPTGRAPSSRPPSGGGGGRGTR